MHQDLNKIAEDLAEDIDVECGYSMPTVKSCVVTAWIRETLQSVAAEVYRKGQEEMREEILKKVYGLCSSDNAAERTAREIRAMRIKDKI